jgi:hypothetical protein
MSAITPKLRTRLRRRLPRPPAIRANSLIAIAVPGLTADAFFQVTV